MFRGIQIIFYLSQVAILFICQNLWSSNISDSKNIAQCQAHIRAYQAGHQSSLFPYNHQVRVKHLLTLLQQSPIDIVERLYLHYLSIKNQDKLLSQCISKCLYNFLALPPGENINMLAMNNRLRPEPLEKLKILASKERGFLSRFDILESDFDEAIGPKIEVLKSRSFIPKNPKPFLAQREAIDVALVREDLKIACEVLRNIDHDQHYDTHNHRNTLNIINNLEMLVRKLDNNGRLFINLHEATDEYQRRKDSSSFDLVKRATRDICQEILQTLPLFTPGELLEKVQKIAYEFKQRKILEAREYFLALCATPEIQKALQDKHSFIFAWNNLEAAINPYDFKIFQASYREIEDFLPTLWNPENIRKFIKILESFKQLPRLEVKILEQAIKNFSILPSAANAEIAREEAHKIFDLIKNLYINYLFVDKNYDLQTQQLYEKYEQALFAKDYAEHQFNTLTRKVMSARPGTVLNARFLALDFATKASLYDPNIHELINNIFLGQ